MSRIGRRFPVTPLIRSATTGLFVDANVSLFSVASIDADVLPGSTAAGGTPSLALWVGVDAAIRPSLLALGTVASASFSATDANVTVGATSAGGTPATAVWVAVNARSPSGDVGVWAPAVLYGDETR